MQEPHGHILIVDDNEDNSHIFATYLEHAGHRVTSAATGPEGLARAAAERPDLMLLDLNLPGLDGWEVARRIKHDPQLARISIVIVTAHHDPANAFLARELGCAELLEKPIEPRLLLDAVRRYLRARGADAASIEPSSSAEREAPPPA